MQDLAKRMNQAQHLLQCNATVHAVQYNQEHFHGCDVMCNVMRKETEEGWGHRTLGHGVPGQDYDGFLDRKV